MVDPRFSQENKALRRHIANRVRFDLAAKFPKCFAAKGQPKRPLKIGIFNDLREAWDRTSYHSLKLGLAEYCAGPGYQSCLVAGADRVDLDGNPAGKVTVEQAARAAEIFSQWPERVRARFVSVAA